MNITPDNIIVNSCEYTPVYLIPSTSVTQAGSYIITQSSQDVQKPVADNLKTFYENSGNLESTLLSSPKPRILKKQNANVVGNNLKLASFLLPKTESLNTVQIQNVSKQVLAPLNNMVVKPVMTAVTPGNITSSVANNGNNNSSVDHTVPRVEIDRKIVRVGTIPPTTRNHYPRGLPKNKPNLQKEKPELKIDSNPSKHTSVQLIKLGETYHSLNQLSDEQMKIVNKALKMFSDPEKIPKEPAYDPVTNTKFIYKVVSPKDLTVVGRNKVNMNVLKKKHEVKKAKVLLPEDPEPDPAPVEQPKVTRSGRTVKLPKQMRPGPEESPHKPKKKVGSVVNCFQCSAEFCSLYRLQRHYEMYPTHIPARIHSNLFHCLLAIIKGGGDEDQGNMFIQQLEQLIDKLKTLLPCLLKTIDGKDGKLCTIKDDIARIFGLNPGKYNLNIDALNCIKDKDGHCMHNPAPKNNQFNSDVSKPSQLWLSKHNEEIANIEAETEDCARINSVDKWPTVTKRFWKMKQQKKNLNAKKMRLASETDQPIELVMEDAVPFNKPDEKCAIKVETNEQQMVPHESSEDLKPVIKETVLQQPAAEETDAPVDNQSKLKTHAQFHSAHFDIRSSPIKLPSALARKFQFNPEKLTRLEVQILRPLALDTDKTDDQAPEQTDSNNFQEIFKDSAQSPKETEMSSDLNFDHAKNWNISAPSETSQDSFMKTSMLFEPSLSTPVKNGSLIDPSLIHVDDKGLFEPSPKTRSLLEANLLEIYQKPHCLIENSVLNEHNKADSFFGTGQSLLQVKEQSNGFCEPSSIHVKPKCNSLIGSSTLNIKALSQVKERSNSLFDSTLLQPSNKTNNLVESLMQGKDDGGFYSTLDETKDRSNNLFDSSLIDMKDKDSLIDPTLLLKDDNSSLFNALTPRKVDLMEQALAHDKVNSLMSQSLMDCKSDARNPINIDVNHMDNLNVSDSRLLSNQGQSVLNFLESLGNESLGLAYPETEIRNNSVDFQLDLFSFNNS